MGVPMIVVLGAAAVAVSIPLLIWGMITSSRSRADVISENLQSIATPVDQRVLQLQESTMSRAVLPAVNALARRVRRITPAGWLEALERRVELAGRESAWTIERALAAKLVFAVLGLLLGLWMASVREGTGARLLAFLLPVIGYFLPDVILRERGRERQQHIGRALPDTLDQITISVEAGLGFDAAMAYVAETGTGPLAEELHWMLQEIGLGVPRERALGNLAKRTDVPELNHFVFAMRQAEQYGIPIAQVLRTQSAELRVKRRYSAEERAMKMPVKLVFPLAFCIFPSLFIVLLGPAVIRIFDALL